MVNLKQIELELLPVDEDLKHLIRRVLLVKGKVNEKSRLCFSPTGFAYVNLNQQNGKGTCVIEDKKYEFGKFCLGNQFRNVLPYYVFEDDFKLVSLELYPDIPYKVMRFTGEELLNSYVPGLEDSIPYLNKVFDNNQKKDPDAASKNLQDFMRQYSRNYEEDDVSKALKVIYQANGLVTQDELESEVSVGQRQLRRKFIQQIGLSPKYYAKVIQFNYAFEIIKSEDARMIKQVALSAGYYDQSHFIRDFKQMVGDTPLKFFNSENEFLRNYLGQFRK